MYNLVIVCALMKPLKIYFLFFLLILNWSIFTTKTLRFTFSFFLGLVVSFLSGLLQRWFLCLLALLFCFFHSVLFSRFVIVTNFPCCEQEIMWVFNYYFSLLSQVMSYYIWILFAYYFQQYFVLDKVVELDCWFHFDHVVDCCCFKFIDEFCVEQLIKPLFLFIHADGSTT